jgi:hypothetical protein
VLKMKTQWGVLTFLTYLVASTVYVLCAWWGLFYIFDNAPGVVGVTPCFAFALMVIGLYFMWGGRKEFGNKHEKFVTIGCWLIPVNFLTWVLLAIPPPFFGVLLVHWADPLGIIMRIAIFLSALPFVLMAYHLVEIIGKFFFDGRASHDFWDLDFKLLDRATPADI